ncbi:MAG: hypothetical protein NTX96_00530 [Candidatus Zambryskibacteria bacterium]|nr:hypothetical protein [Candidatus Zambryskibacteria bacterium]
MADEKKPEAKPAELSWFSHPDPFVEIVWLGLSTLVILYLINGFISMFDSSSFSIFEFDITKAKSLFWEIFSYLKYIIILISLLLSWGIVYLYKKVVLLREEEAKLFYIENVGPKEMGNPQWEKILNYVESTNENDWRLAILEADIMLNTLLDNLGLPGETMADKLKAVEKSDFTTIDNAWEAHKIRNQIAHEGATFVMNQQESKRVISLYQSVFEEFRII